MALLIAAVVVAAIFLGLGFVAHWLFIGLVLAAILALISFFTRRTGTRTY